MHALASALFVVAMLGASCTGTATNGTRPERTVEVPSAAGTSAAAPCGSDIDARNAAPPTGDPTTVGVYFSCRADAALLGTPEQPVYLALREIPASLAGSDTRRLEGAVRAYLAGPTPDERKRGYSAAASNALAATIEDVSIDGSSATIDFSSDVADHIGNLTAGTAGQVFQIELGATVFQFDGIDRLTLQMEGNCEDFWHLMERSCSVIRRPS